MLTYDAGVELDELPTANGRRAGETDRPSVKTNENSGREDFPKVSKYSSQ